MNKKPLLLWILGGVCLAATGFWALTSREPQVEGMPASRFVRSLLETNRIDPGKIARRCLPIGTNRMVLILTDLAERDDAWLRRLHQRVHPRLPKWAQRRLGLPKSHEALSYHAIWMLSQYGKQAAPAAGVLGRILLRVFKAPKPQQGVARYNRSSIIIECLRRMGPGAKETVPDLLTYATSTNAWSERHLAFSALSAIDPDGKHSALALISAWMDQRQSSGVRHGAFSALAQMARHTPSLLTNFHRAFEERWLSRTPITAVLARFQALTLDQVMALTNDLATGTASVCADAARALAHADRFAEVAVPALCATARETDARVSEAAVQSLRALASNTNVARPLRWQAARQTVRRGQDADRWTALSILQECADRPDDLFSELELMLSDKNERLRARAADSLARMSSAAQEAVPELRRLLNDEWGIVRDAGTNALRAMNIEP